MTSVKRMDSASTTPATQVTSEFAGLPAPRKPIPHDLPALPGSDLAALRARIDAWDVRPATVTREAAA